MKSSLQSGRAPGVRRSDSVLMKSEGFRIRPAHRSGRIVDIKGWCWIEGEVMARFQDLDPEKRKASRRRPSSVFKQETILRHSLYLCEG